MEKIEMVTYTTERPEHHFYCDDCGDWIGVSEEYDDGWYAELGEFELDFYINGWYRIKKCLCHDCAKGFLSNLKNHLEDIGFKRN